MGMEKTRLLACESVHWININADMENTIENFLVCFNFQATQPKGKTLSHEITGRPGESLGADIFSIN